MSCTKSGVIIKLAAFQRALAIDLVRDSSEVDLVFLDTGLGQEFAAILDPDYS